MDQKDQPTPQVQQTNIGQKGGVAVGKVDTLNYHAGTPEEKPSWLRLLISYKALISYAIIAILSYAGCHGTASTKKDVAVMPENPIQVNQTNIGQTGGIAAGNVQNLHVYPTPPPRHMTADQKTLTDSTLSPYREWSIKVTSPLMDAEARNFAAEMREYLRLNGYNLNPVVQEIMRDPPVPRGQIAVTRDQVARILSIDIGPQ